MKRWLAGLGAAGWLFVICVSGAGALEHPCVVNFRSRLEALVGRGESASFALALYTRHGRAFGAEMRVFVQERISGEMIDAEVSVYSADPADAPVDLLREEYILTKLLRAGDELEAVIRPSAGVSERCRLRLKDFKEDALPYYQKMLRDHEALIYDLGLVERAPWDTWDNTQYPGVEWDVLQRVWTMTCTPVIGATQAQSGYRFTYERPEDEPYHGTRVTRFEATVRRQELSPQIPALAAQPQALTPEQSRALNERLNRALIRRTRLENTVQGDACAVSLLQPESRGPDGVWAAEDAVLLLSGESAFAYELYLDGTKISQGRAAHATENAVQKRLILRKEAVVRARRMQAVFTFEDASLAPETHTALLRPPERPAPYPFVHEEFSRDYKDYLASYPDWTVELAPVLAEEGIASVIRFRREGMILERF